NPCSPDITIKYISRYLGRPVIATSRIDAYDGTSVTFHYQRHEDHETVTECISAIDFIKRLIVHIPDRHGEVTSSLFCYAIFYFKSIIQD
ncbi:MAG: transposase, partial [Enterocloster clostridioformis]|nr:transposase [Enterocloster clostridioformis]